MSASRYIGRIGGLATVLGVGAAVVAGSGVACADTDTSGSPAGGTATESSADGTQSVGTSLTAQNPAANSGPRTRGARTAAKANRSATSALPLPAPARAATNGSGSGAGAGVGDAIRSLKPAKALFNAPAPVPAAAVGDSRAVTNIAAHAVGSVVAIPAAATVVAPAASIPSLTASLSVPSGLLAALPPKVAAAAPGVIGGITTALHQIVNLFSGNSPLTPAVDSPLAWALLAVARRPHAAAAVAPQQNASSTAPVMVLNGFNVVNNSVENVSSFYGLYTAVPGIPASVQGERQYAIVDPTSGQTVGTFDALVTNNNSFGLGTLVKFHELVVTDVVSGPVGTDAGQIPPVGSVLASIGTGKYGMVYSAMPTQTGDVLSTKLLTPFGDLTLPVRFNAASQLTDYGLVNKPLNLTNGSYIAPQTPSTEIFTSSAGIPPFYNGIQGSQKYSVYNSATDAPVGSFDGLVTTTKDFFGLYTKAIYVTGNDGTAPQGLGPDQLPPAGTVYNVIYLFGDKNYLLYESAPKANGGYVHSTRLVTPQGSIPLPLPFNASKPASDAPLQVPGNYAFVPVSPLQVSGINGLPPREVIIQGYQQFDIYNQRGEKIGSVDADVTSQWNIKGDTTQALLVTNVRSGTPGIAKGDVPPVGSVFSFMKNPPIGSGLFNSSRPTPIGNVNVLKYALPFGYIPLSGGTYNAAAGMKDYTFTNPFLP